jgi:hypothetical protein
MAAVHGCNAGSHCRRTERSCWASIIARFSINERAQALSPRNRLPRLDPTSGPGDSLARGWM